MKTFIFVFIFAALTSPSLYAITVDEAYAAIPHRRTEFHDDQAKMPKAHSKYLSELFQLVDLAIVLRIQGMNALSQGKFVEAKQDNDYRSLLKKFSDLKIEDVQLGRIRDLIKEAAADQASLFLELSDKKMKMNFEHPAVGTSSSKLHQAYGALMSAYPSENQSNKEAFFDYLCALDFR